MWLILFQYFFSDTLYLWKIIWSDFNKLHRHWVSDYCKLFWVICLTFCYHFHFHTTTSCGERLLFVHVTFNHLSTNVIHQRCTFLFQVLSFNCTYISACKYRTNYLVMGPLDFNREPLNPVFSQAVWHHVEKRQEKLPKPTGGHHWWLVTFIALH